MLGLVIALVFIGMVSGYLARLFVAGPDPMGFLKTILLGLVGSFIGGTIGTLIFHGELKFGLGGIGLAIPGAMIALLIYRKVKYGNIMPHRDYPQPPYR